MNEVPPAAAGETDHSAPDTSLDRVDAWSFGVSAIAALTVYLLTLAPDVTLAFSGIFSTGSMYGGVPHPPGYPLSTVYGWAFAKLIPISNMAFRLALASALAGALACGMVALIISRLGRGLMAGVTGTVSRPINTTLIRIGASSAAALVLGFTGGVWSRAIIADVWTLSLLSFCLVLHLLIRWSEAPKRWRYLVAAFFIYGLGLTNSQILLAAAPTLPFLVAIGDRGVGRGMFFGAALLSLGGLAGIFLDWLPPWSGLADSYDILPVALIWTCFVMTFLAGALALKTPCGLKEWKATVACGIGCLLGLSLNWYVPVISMTNPPMNWGYPRTVAGFFHVMERGQYDRIRLPVDVRGLLDPLRLYFEVVGAEFGWINLAIALLPLALLRHMPKRERIWMLGLLLVFLCLGPLVMAVLGPGGHNEGRQVIKVFSTLSCLIIAIWMGCGLMLVARRLQNQTPLH